MRHILCAKCMEGKTPGTRQTHARSDIGEPAEFERVVAGIAKKPRQIQRMISVNGVCSYLSLEFFNCDRCDGEIRPGDKAGAITAWTEATVLIAEWEREYLEF